MIRHLVTLNTCGNSPFSPPQRQRTTWASKAVAVLTGPRVAVTVEWDIRPERVKSRQKVGSQRVG